MGVQGQLAPFRHAREPFRVELVECRLPALPHVVGRVACGRPHPQIVMRQVDPRQDDDRTVFCLFEERQIVAHVVAAPEVPFAFQKIERVARTGTALAHPSHRPPACGLGEHLRHLAHFGKFGRWIVVAREHVLGPTVRDDLASVVGELAHDFGMTFAGETVGRDASFDLELVHQIEQPPRPRLVGVLGVGQREVINLVWRLLQGELARAHEQFERHVERHGDLGAIRPRPLAGIVNSFSHWLLAWWGFFLMCATCNSRYVLRMCEERRPRSSCRRSDGKIAGLPGTGTIRPD